MRYINNRSWCTILYAYTFSASVIFTFSLMESRLPQRENGSYHCSLESVDFQNWLNTYWKQYLKLPSMHCLHAIIQINDNWWTLADSTPILSTFWLNTFFKTYLTKSLPVAGAACSTVVVNSDENWTNKYAELEIKRYHSFSRTKGVFWQHWHQTKSNGQIRQHCLMLTGHA